MTAALHLALYVGTALKSPNPITLTCVQAVATFEAALKRLKDTGLEIERSDNGADDC